EERGLALVHIIGPNTGHSYHPEAKKAINQRIDSIVALGRNPIPRRVCFTTWTLRYHQSFWVIVDGLDQHWEQATVDAALDHDDTVRITTHNVTALTLSMPPGHCPLDPRSPPRVIIDGRTVWAAPVQSDRSWVAHFQRGVAFKSWSAVPTRE